MKCLLDMDGIIADFVEGMCQLHGRENPYLLEANRGNFDMDDIWGMTPDEFWALSNGPDFWKELPLTEEAHQIVELVSNKFGEENVCILSSPNKDPYCMHGKYLWLLEHFPQFERRFLFGTSKEFCASPKRILIDDKDKNVDDFIDSGGIGILVPRPWNTKYALSDRSLETLKESLANLQLL